MITKIEKTEFKCKTCGHKFEGIYAEGGIKAGANNPPCPKCGSNATRQTTILDKIL